MVRRSVHFVVNLFAVKSHMTSFLQFFVIWSFTWVTYILCSRDQVASYAGTYPVKFILGYCTTYIFMQTFMIPGTIFMSLLAGALFGVGRGLILVVFNATAGASSCYFLSKLIGRPIVNWLWPEKLRYFQAEVPYLFLSISIFNYKVSRAIWMKMIFPPTIFSVFRFLFSRRIKKKMIVYDLWGQK